MEFTNHGYGLFFMQVNIVNKRIRVEEAAEVCKCFQAYEFVVDNSVYLNIPIP
jgi:hypothetical protein